MSWRDNLIEASFKGAKFKVKKHDLEVGRNITIYPFYIPEKNNAGKPLNKPQNLLGYVKDNGPVPDKITIEGYVIQNTDNSFNYFIERDELIKQLKSSGAGILRHPYYGEINAQGGITKISEDFENGGICTFNMQFTQKSKDSFIQVPGDYNARVDAAAAKARASIGDNFFDKFRTGTQFVSQTIGSAQNMMANVQNSLYSITGAVQSTVSSAVATISAASSLITSVISSPCDLYNTLAGGLDAIKTIVGMAGETISSAVTGGCSGETKNNPFTMDGESIPSDLGISIIEVLLDQMEIDNNQDVTAEDETLNNIVIQDGIKANLFILICQITIRIEFTSQDIALSILKNIIDRLEAFLEAMGDEDSRLNNYETFAAMQSLRSTFVLTMNDKISSFKKEVIYTLPPYGISSLELSYNLYKDISRENEIIKSNKAAFRHPAFGYGSVRALDA